MFINIPAAGPATLEDADNFKAFKVVNAAASDSVFADIGRREGDHAWIDTAWLKANGRPDDATWLANLDKMLAYAKTSGWLDDTGAVRAHIESV